MWERLITTDPSSPSSGTRYSTLQTVQLLPRLRHERAPRMLNNKLFQILARLFYRFSALRQTASQCQKCARRFVTLRELIDDAAAHAFRIERQIGAIGQRGREIEDGRTLQLRQVARTACQHCYGF